MENFFALIIIFFVFGSIGLLFNKELYGYFFPLITWFKRIIKKRKR